MKKLFSRFRKIPKEELYVELPTDSPVQLEAYSSTWKFIESWANKKRSVLNAKNESQSLSEIQTAVIRGQIKQLKQLLNLPRAEGRTSPHTQTFHQEAERE